MTLNEKLATIQTKFKSKKSRFNSFGKYYFRSAEDILEATKPFLLELGVSVIISEQIVSSDPFPIMETTAAISDGKTNIIATAMVGVDLDQKGMQMPQKFGSASSYGKKYALGNLLLIDDTADSDATNTHDKSAQRQTLKAQVSNTVVSQKPTVDMSNIDQAKKFLANGGLLKTLQEKYEITAEALKQLNG